MSGRLAGKTAVVTAAGQGIGRATAIAFVEEGATVWATDINEAALKALGVEQPTIVCRKLDVRNPKEIEALAQELPERRKPVPWLAARRWPALRDGRHSPQMTAPVPR